jgi:hypothetical protein
MGLLAPEEHLRAKLVQLQEQLKLLGGSGEHKVEGAQGRQWAEAVS